jgi:predicted TIM-barrel fold metal-dependent hydrolase
MAAAICSALNDWLAHEWLDKDSRLRGSIVVPVNEPAAAVKEIQRLADDERFVQVLFPVAGDMPFGRRYFWPIYEEAQKRGLPIAIHPGGGGRFPPSYDGWHGLYTEDIFLQAHILQSQIQSLVYEGVFAEFPDLVTVILESGVSWLPAFMTDCDNKWMALRREVPWVKDMPSDIIRRHFRFSTQPFDAPAGDEAARIVEMVGSDDIFLFATDHPHWQYDGDDPFPPGFPAQLREKIAGANPLATYSRIKGASA